MTSTTIAIDLAKTVFELAVADAEGTVIERKRLSRTQLHRYFDNREVGRVIMEACGTAHYWGRWFAERGIAVTLLPTTPAPDYPFNIEFTGWPRVDGILDFGAQPGELLAASLLMQDRGDDGGFAAAIFVLTYLRSNELLEGCWEFYG
jgi:hypothetical protein